MQMGTAPTPAPRSQTEPKWVLYIAEHADFWQAFSSQHSEVVAENLAGIIKN